MIKFVTTKFKSLIVISDAASDVSISIQQTSEAFFVFQNIQELPAWTSVNNSVIAADPLMWMYVGAFESASQQILIFSDTQDKWLPH